MYLNNPLVKPFLRLFGVKVGKNAKFYGLPVIVRDKKSEINIGNDFTLSSAFLANLIGLYQRSVIVSRFGAKIEIGNNVGMSGVSVYAMDSVKIGNDTIIGGNTKIFDSDLHPLDPEIRRADTNNREHTKKKPVKIGENCFIGCNCIILKGTELGDNCIVGAGSVVSGKFEANSVIAGNPAKVIKKI